LAVSVTPLRVGQEEYWLDQIAHDRCGYYLGRGESPGWWAGALTERSGLTASPRIKPSVGSSPDVFQ
jgi:hypothetical protein